MRLCRLCAPGQEKGRGELREQFPAAHGVRCAGPRAGAEGSVLSLRSGRASAEDRRWEAEEQLSVRLCSRCAPGQEKGRGELREQFLAAPGVRCTGPRAGAECSALSVRSGRASAEDRRWEAEEQLSGRLSRLCAPGQEKGRGELGEQFLAAPGVRCAGPIAGAECSVCVGAFWQSECRGSAKGG